MRSIDKRVDETARMKCAIRVSPLLRNKRADRVIFKNCKELVGLEGFEVEEFTTSVIDLTQDLKTIWKNMSRKGVRRGIRRAEHMGVKVRLSEDYEQFYQIFRSFIRKRA